jgi:DNA-binding transcriptional regulator GbsR (MarR family)
MSDLNKNITNIEKIHFIEDIALFFERIGTPRMAGKILGVLLISDPPAQSITEISESLKVSKSSISIMARLLVENGLIERVASPIPRQDYYRFKDGGWILYMRQWMALMSELHKIAERGLVLMEEKSEDLKMRLLEAHDMFSLMEESFPALLKQLENERNQRTTHSL